MSFSRHQHFEELISASLGGELSDSERADLDAHLDGCDACRATLAAFADQRRIVAGLRHVAAPRDLGARVRTGIESGAFGGVPWWRRPAVLVAGFGGGLAAVAGALLGIALLTAPNDDEVGVSSPSAVPSAAATPSPAPETPAPSPTLVAATPSPTPAATAAPVQLAPEPDVYLAYTGPFDNLLLTLRDGRSGGTVRELTTPGPAIAAEMSPNGQFLAYISEQGQSGMNQLWVLHLGSETGTGGPDAIRVETPLAQWDSLELGQSAAGSEFLERLTWSANSQLLAFTIAATDGSGTDAWLFDAADASITPVTTTGTGYAASWVGTQSGPQLLWVSLAGEQPSSQLIDVADASTSLATTGTFQPLLSPDGSHAIYWKGVMRREGTEWAFVQGGAPYLAEARAIGDSFEFVNERPLFSDVTIDRDAFTSAGIAWGADSDAYAVWDAMWTGIPQGAGGEYPNANRIYFGHASDDRELTEVHAIDAADLPEGASVVDVKVPTTRHLLVTARVPIGGVMDAPRALLILVARNTGQVADEVFTFTGPGDGGWFGPGAYDAYYEPVTP